MARRPVTWCTCSVGRGRSTFRAGPRTAAGSPSWRTRSNCHEPAAGRTDAGSRGEMEGTSVTVDVRGMLCNDGTSIPQLGRGVFQMSEAEAEAAVVTAHQAGYRLVDSAAGYENEGAVGRAIARFDRDDFYVTTKLKSDDHGYDETLAAFDSSMAKLAIDTLDLYLIHWPSPGRDRYV